MRGGRFPRLSVRDHEARASPFLCPITILRFPLVLRILDRPETIGARSGARTATAEDRKETPTRAQPTADRRIARRAVKDREESRRACLDAAARCRDHGTFLQQRPALERTGGARRFRCRSLYRISARFWKRPEGTRLSGRLTGVGSDLQVSRRGERSFRSTFHK